MNQCVILRSEATKNLSSPRKIYPFQGKILRYAQDDTGSATDPFFEVNYSLFCQQLLDAHHGLTGQVGIAKGGEADIALAGRAKASAGGGDHIGLV